MLLLGKPQQVLTGDCRPEGDRGLCRAARCPLHAGCRNQSGLGHRVLRLPQTEVETVIEGTIFVVFLNLRQVCNLPEFTAKEAQLEAVGFAGAIEIVEQKGSDLLGQAAVGQQTIAEDDHI